MNMKKLLVLVSAVTLASSAAAQAQTLPEIAKAEKARRAQLRKAGGPAKMYTESDRRGGDVSETETAGTPSAAAAALTGSAGARKEKTPEEIAAEKQAEWSEKVKKAQDEIKELEATIARNERVMGSLINITPQRHDLGLQIEADKKKLVELQKSLVSLEDERRRAGMPRPR